MNKATIESTAPSGAQDALALGDQIEALRPLVATTIFFGILGGGLLCIALGPYISRDTRILWYTGIILVQIPLTVSYLKNYLRPNVVVNAASLEGFYYSNGLVIALFWATFLCCIADPAKPEIQFLIACALAGRTTATVTALAFHPQIGAAYLFFLVVPFSVRVISFGGAQYIALGAGLLLLTWLQIFLGRNHENFLRNLIELRHKNEALAVGLELKAQALEQANLSKSRFFAAASHDLRQPLQALSYYTSLLDPSPEDARMVARINECIGALDDLLESVLDISRLDSGKVQAHIQAVSLEIMLKRLASLYEGAAKTKGLELRVRCNNEWASSDPVLLERVLSNLLSNALRYTHQGGVLLTVRRRDDRMRLQVFDTGEGIPLDKQDQVFDEFFQLGNTERNTAKGVGLGLATVRRLCVLLNHPVTLRSIPDRGSCFELDLPRADPVPQVEERTVAEPRSEAQSALTGRVLLVEDHDQVRESLVATMTSWGLECAWATDAGSALALAAQQQFDVVLCDYRLPGRMNGVAVLDAVGKLQTGLRYVSLLTGEDSAVIENLPADLALLRKPIRPIRLRAVLTAHLMPANETPTLSKCDAPR